jgi:hypothetical protein
MGLPVLKEMTIESEKPPIPVFLYSNVTGFSFFAVWFWAISLTMTIYLLEKFLDPSRDSLKKLPRFVGPSSRPLSGRSFGSF